MGCELLDFRCIIVSELVGNAVLAVILGAVIYFMIASKLRWGFDTTIAFGFPFLLVLGLSLAGFSVLYAFLTVIVGIMLGWIFTEMFRGR